MPKKYPIEDKREWLDLYESGLTEVAIADRKGKKDIRTVKSGIEEARREREVAAARAEILKEALLNHRDSLLGIIHDLLSALGVPEQDIMVKGKGGRGWPGIENTVTWELLKEHLKRDPMWKAIARWKKAIATHDEAKLALWNETARLLREKTGLAVDETTRSTQESQIYFHTVDLLCQEAEHRALVPNSKLCDFEKLLHAADDGRVCYCNQPLANPPNGQGQKCKDEMLEAFKELQTSTAATSFAATYKEVGEATAKATAAVEEVSLLGMIPGRCRVCRRLGI